MSQHPNIYTQTWVDENTLLGAKQADFHWQNLILFYVTCISIGFCCSVYSVTSSIFIFPITLIIITITISVGMWFFHMRVTVYENGFKVRTFGSSQVCLWTSIAQVFDNCDKDGRPTYLTITHRNGYQIAVPSSLRAFSKLAQTIINQFTAVNFDESLSLLHNGGELYFGTVILDETHFEVESKRLPLSRIETFHLERYGRIQLRVRAQEDKLRWLSLSELPVPNRHLLRQLVLALRAETENTTNGEPPSSMDIGEVEADSHAS